MTQAIYDDLKTKHINATKQLEEEKQLNSALSESLRLMKKELDNLKESLQFFNQECSFHRSKATKFFNVLNVLKKYFKIDNNTYLIDQSFYETTESFGVGWVQHNEEYEIIKEWLDNVEYKYI